ncbi:hypothetical protein ACFZAR_00470 [Streptomyces sp. NPDC008222]|uniref:hypothetical protein n=1 Tax=Streptomyces sp. NPDC008222 TaxID=3364820 RepID=UPI0036E8F91B
MTNKAEAGGAADNIGGLDTDVLPWVESAVGNELLGYILDCTPESLSSLMSGDLELSQKQAEVVQAFGAFKASVSSNLGDDSTQQAVRVWATQTDDEGKTIARNLRTHVRGEDDIPAGRDGLERALTLLALDSYPVFLLPPEELDFPLPMMEKVSFRVASFILRHPQAKVFTEAAMQDATFKRIFTESNEHAGYTTFVLRNTGSGGGLQLSLIADMILRAAWRRAQHGVTSPGSFVEEALRQLGIVRDALAGKPQTVVAKIGLAGVLLPVGAQLELDGALVRPVTETEREMAPASLKGALNSTDGSGNTATINYDGDLVLEYSYPYKVRTHKGEWDGAGSWPEDMLPPESLENTVMRLRFSLLMAVRRDFRAQLAPTWRTFDEPLSQGVSMSWSDPRQNTSLFATQLSDTELTAWGEWYKRLSAQHFKRVELALSRTLRAAAERRDPSDVLIDAVIAWENLFGTKDGEPTFRITMCLARLIESSPADRLELKRELGKIYTLRSNVVHGSAALKASDYPRCQKALEVAIEAIRILATERVDILALPTGADRSAALLLEG